MGWNTIANLFGTNTTTQCRYAVFPNTMKRKQLKNSISGGLQIKSKVARDLLEAAEIDPQRRAETLTIEEWGQLTRTVMSADVV